MQSMVCGQGGASRIELDMFTEDLRNIVGSWVRAGNKILAMPCFRRGAVPLCEIVHQEETSGARTMLRPMGKNQPYARFYPQPAAYQGHP
jgi:hypothetical protein